MCTKLERLARQAVLVFCCCLVVQCGVIYPTVRWSPSNPMFKEDTLLCVTSYSKISLECPNPATVLTQQAHSQSRDNMYENMWLVDEQGYKTCTVDPSKHRLLKQCDNPDSLNYLEIVFQHYTPLPNGLKFDRGKVYYLINTASGTIESLQDKSNGRCLSNNMRLKIYICNGAADPKCQDRDPPAITSNLVTTVSVVTVTKTETVCPTVDPAAAQPAANPIQPTQSLAQAQATPIRFKYATLLSSLASSSTISPSATQAQTGMQQTATLPQPVVSVQIQ